MATPAKKTTPAKAFADRVNLGKKDDDEEKQDQTPAIDSKEDDNNENTASVDELNNNDNSDGIEYNKGDTVKTPEKGTDNQAADQSTNSDFLNPDGVTHSGLNNPINKTPAEISAETPEETQKRYAINDDIPDDVHNNPNVKATQDNTDYQIPGGTHVHPDVAKDNYNRMAGGRPSESAQVSMTQTQLVFAEPAPVDDKGINNKQPENLAD